VAPKAGGDQAAPRATTPRPPIAARPVESPEVAAPPVVFPAAAHPVATVSGPPAAAERAAIWSLLDSGRLDEGAARIKPLVSKDPEAAWPRLALGVLYYRKYWRHDAVKEWQLALAHDPEVQHDPQFGAYLCFMLDDTWKAAGATELLDQLGPQAAPLLDRCVASARTPRLRGLAARARDSLGHGAPRPGQ
jgi:hypothetical protein